MYGFGEIMPANTGTSTFVGDYLDWVSHGGLLLSDAVSDPSGTVSEIETLFQVGTPGQIAGSLTIPLLALSAAAFIIRRM